MDRILVVDDDPLILAALSRILQSEGYEVVTHSDPAQAAKEEGFQVVLTDFMMPLLNGVELLRTLREKNPRAVIHSVGPWYLQAHSTWRQPGG